MKTVLACIFIWLSVVAADSQQIKVATQTYKVMPEDALATVEVFTRGGQTNLVRRTHTKDGVVLFRLHSFYHDGVQTGTHMYQVANGTNTVLGSTPGSPYHFGYVLDAFNRPKSAQIRTTNFVMVDWYFCTNGVFYPADSSEIREANEKLPKNLPPH